jgi:hypothetical protein
MSYPTQSEIKLPLLDAIALRGGCIVFSRDGDALEQQLADHFCLSDAARSETRENINIKGKRVWRLNIQWARKKLVADGLLDGAVRDHWSLTSKGRAFAIRRGSHY